MSRKVRSSTSRTFIIGQQPIDAKLYLFSILYLSALFSSSCAPPNKRPERSTEVESFDGGRERGQHAALIELGRLLFYERRLSLNGDRSCGICHEQAKGFTDGFVRAVGTTGELHPRNTFTLINVARRETLSWLSPESQSLEEQLLTPLLGENPVEQGAAPIIERALPAFSMEPPYRRLLEALKLETLTLPLLARAISSFVRTIRSEDSAYDRALQGEEGALSDLAERGRTLFFSERVGCTRCHGGLDFDQPEGVERHGWYNTGLYLLPGGRYPSGREGLYEISGADEDIGKYRVPTLRGLAFTAPYYHDGTGASLRSVLRAYNEGGRLVRSGPFAGDGRLHPNKDPRIRPLGLHEEELEALEAFLLSLSDPALLDDSRWADPIAHRDALPSLP